MPEISDQEYALLQRSQQILGQLNGDPRTRPLLEQGLKVHYPQVTTEVEARDALINPVLEEFRNTVIKPLQERLDADATRQQEQQQQQTEHGLTTAFDRLRRERGFTDDGIEAVKKLMVDRSIADPDAAAALFAEQNPPAPEPTTGFTPQHWNLDQTASDHDVEGLFKDEDRWADNMAGKVLNEIRMGQAA